MTSKEKTRFDTRLSSSQKELFERAARLGGYKTLSEFILSSAQQKADHILELHRQILSDEKDRKVFFDALLNPPKPNAALKKSMANYVSDRSKK
jgi:uncharacterized protein (DUF1778 family)